MCVALSSPKSAKYQGKARTWGSKDSASMSAQAGSVLALSMEIGAALGATCRCIAAVHQFVYQNCLSVCGGCLECHLQMHCSSPSICVSKLSDCLWGLPWVPPADALPQSIHLCIKTVRLFVGAALSATCRCIAAVHPFVYQNCLTVCGGCLECHLQMHCRNPSICVSKLSVCLWGLP